MNTRAIDEIACKQICLLKKCSNNSVENWLIKNRSKRQAIDLAIISNHLKLCQYFDNLQPSLCLEEIKTGFIVGL